MSADQKSFDNEHSDNVVFLRGRLAAAPQYRVLPSGDELCSFRLTVDRPEGERVRVDSIECATTVARVRACLARADVGVILEVNGRLHRRFWRGSGGLASRYEVQAAGVRVIRRRRSAA